MSQNRYRYQEVQILHVLTFCMYAMCVFYVCIRHMLSILCAPGMYVVYEWKDGTDGAISELLFFWSHFRCFLYKPNERKSLEFLFIWTLARRVRNARNSQEIPVSWTYQFVDAAGICLLQAQPISKCTEFSKNCVHSAPVRPGSK